MRCPAASTFSAVKDFIASKKQSDLIYLIPSSGQFAKKLSKKKQRALKAIQLRIILLNHPDGKSVLLTNLPEKKEFSDAEIINLY
jgi:hypothetical protein